MNLTDNEIIKVLECCSDTDCDNCPFEEQCRRNGSLSDIALNLINRQKAEIERYRGVIKLLEKDVKDANRKWWVIRWLKRRIHK